jgi:hypothetical protein
LNFEEAFALNGDVELFARLVQLALGENLRGRSDTRTVTDLDAGRDDVAAACVGAGGAGLLVEEILKLDLAALEAGGVHVREIVRDRIQILLLSFHAGGGGVEGEIHEAEELEVRKR